VRRLRPGVRARTALLLAALVLMWGLSWPVYKIALDYTPPILFAGMRTLLGGLLLSAVLLPRRGAVRWRQTWRVYGVAALYNGFLFYGLQTVGLRYLPEGLFTVLVYLQPVLVGLFAWLWLGESMSAGKWTGLLAGFAGVGVISAGSLSGRISALGVILALLAALAWAAGTVYVKRTGDRVDALWLVAFQCLLGGAGLTAIGLLTEHASGIVWNTPYMAGLAYGAVFGIPASWIVFVLLIRAGEAGKVASFTFLVPLIAIFIGTLFLREPFTLDLLAGLVLIVAGILLVNRAAPLKSRKSSESLPRHRLSRR
jgi:drug/metabolite transporter (DMT)-like permease